MRSFRGRAGHVAACRSTVRFGRGAGAALVALLVLLATAWPASASAAELPTRYSLVHGCYALQSVATGRFVVRRADGGYRAEAIAAGGAEAFRMQATALGRYLFYGRDRTAITRGDGGGVLASEDLGPAGDWRVEPAGAGRFRIEGLNGGVLAVDGGGTVVAPPRAEGQTAAFRFVAAGNCTVFPEAEINAVGTPARGSWRDGEVRGLIDGHNHPVSFNFIGGAVHCGRIWSPYGIEKALVDCPDHALLGGGAALLENFLGGHVVGFHDPSGYPSLKDWPRYDSLTHEGAYWRWVERAWRGGLRMMVVDFTDNGVLCRIWPIRNHSCDEMETLREQLRDTEQLQDYIDAQFGGPGKGFFRIVKSPQQARRVINDGKLAIVLGLESAAPFNCSLPNDTPACTPEQMEQRLDEMYRLGVRNAFPVHKFDNAFGGTTGDDGLTGVLTNVGNLIDTSHFLRLQRCADGHPSDRYDDDDIPRIDAVADLLTLVGRPGALPVYPAGPLCNPRGLSDLGRQLIERMISKGMMIDVDHMSVKTRDEALKLLEQRRYPGVLSSHNWSDETTPKRIYQLGGFVALRADGTNRFVERWKVLREQRDPRFLFGLGYGADINGFGAQSGPRDDNAKNPVRYPFRSIDGAVTLDRNRTGNRVFDLNQEGVAQYGLYPDWYEDLRQIAGQPIVNDLLTGAEAYLQTWERATGVPYPGCKIQADALGRSQVGPLRLGESTTSLLRRVGQPAARPLDAYRYCVTERDGRQATLAAVFGDDGRTVAMTSTARQHRVAGLRVGSSARRVGRVAKRVGRGLWVRRARSRTSPRVVLQTSNGRISAIAIVAPERARASSLRRTLRLAGVR
ncbi:membrane dipeptidase [Patulibacter defluvii]|uniref:membrane dipeptidase n=1 Tax=Patulibacter defluvii TaxID=3095358 RepID=UPI002A7511DB|nr:membrane dipeptidase [Patulibacter sp. DM4]